MSINELVTALTARLIDAVQINDTRPVMLNNRSFWLKQRRFLRSIIIVCGNLFLKYSNSKIIMFSRTHEWQTWEVESYRLLYGEQSELAVIGSNAVRIPNIRGTSLKRYLEKGDLNAEIMRAAGIEFQRVHSLQMSLLNNETWSHGDAHLENVLYDAETHQSHLIDFETRHQLDLSELERHADDLLVLLLDLLGRDVSENWLELSTAFLEAYANRPVLEILANRLIMPTGLEAVLWKTRTNHLSREVLAQRLTLLKKQVRLIISLLASK